MLRQGLDDTVVRVVVTARPTIERRSAGHAEQKIVLGLARVRRSNDVPRDSVPVLDQTSVDAVLK